LNATLVYRYDDTELNGAIDSTLRLFRSTDNGTSWQAMGGAVNGTANTITLSAINEFSRWTAATPSAPPLPAQVVLVSPAHGATVGADSVKCVWLQSTPAVTGYWFEQATDSLFTVNRVVDSTLTDTTKVTRQLVTNTTYWWRVRAKNVTGWGPFSAGRRFIAIFTGVDETELAPREFRLMQNYPNPFNPSTTIKFSVATSARAVVELYNVLGQKIAVLFEGFVEAGKYHHVEFDGRGFPSGIYFYSLQSGERNELKKLVLLK
jgi:hypothetical protein